ncbi:SDR family oxidoreductase [Desulfonatronum parangueonense]
MRESDSNDRRTAVVTGGSSGIGNSLVRKFRDEGIVTAFADIAVPREEIQGAAFYQVDIADPVQVCGFINDVGDSLGIPDIIVCNAGRGIHELLKEGDPENWEMIFRINVFGALRIVRGFLEGMLQKGHGDIVFISSVSSRRPYIGGGVYAATKAAIDMIAETLRLEVQPVIRVTNVAPGVVDTPFFVNIIHGDQTPESIGWGALEPDDVAEAVCFAISRPPGVAVNNLVIRPVAQPM